jgi:hypothetical protein
VNLQPFGASAVPSGSSRATCKSSPLTSLPPDPRYQEREWGVRLRYPSRLAVPPVPGAIPRDPR